MIKKIWILFLTAILNTINFGSILPTLVSSNHTELVMIAPILGALVLTCDFFIIKMLFFKKEEEKENV
jgi:hypothetical protein